MIYNVDNKISPAGSFLSGYVYCTYYELVQLFGTPKPIFTNGKIKCRWMVKWEDGIVCTIYDWKSPHTIQDTIIWHIGTFSKEWEIISTNRVRMLIMSKYTAQEILLVNELYEDNHALL